MSGSKLSQSIYRRISRGFAAENKDRYNDEGDIQRILHVLPIEILPEATGDIKKDLEKVMAKGITPDNKPFLTEVKRGMTIPAVWAGATNHITPPDIRRGERIDLYQLGDSPIYYWACAGLDDHLRRLETVVRAYSANPENEDGEQTVENCYTETWSTHDGHITIRTTKLNKEAAAFVIQINTKKGYVTIEDEKGNHIFLDSVNSIIELLNVDLSKVRLEKKDIFIESVKNIFGKTETVTVECKTANVKASDAINFETKTMKVKASDIEVTGNTVFKSPVKMEAGMETTNIKADDIKTGKINHDSHAHP